MTLSVWIGALLGGAVIAWALQHIGAVGTFLGGHAIIIVYGGSLAATLISTPGSMIWSALARFVRLFFPDGIPSLDQAIAEVVRLARQAQSGGGILAIQGESLNFARGFLHRAIVAAVSSGETAETRRMMEAEIRRRRSMGMEDSNTFRTVGILTPMFGLLGTLIGMVKVLQTMSDPTRVGPAMALALSSAFLGISTANLICVPVAGHIRLKVMDETLIHEVLLEGVLDIASGKSPYVVELHLSSYAARRRAEAEEAQAGGRQASAASAP